MAAPPTAKTVLTLSGQRKQRRLVAFVNDIPLELSYGQFRILVRLILARGKGGTGFVADQHALYPEAIRRLRRVMDRAGPNLGNTLIETGAISEYRLGIDLAEVSIKKCCLELQQSGVLGAVEIEGLQKLFVQSDLFDRDVIDL
jgi:hypothetical protein